jgi:mono/diheme cytochrome c family protein
LKTPFFFFGIGLCLIGMLSCHESPYMQGKRLYDANCQSCHMEDGNGLSQLIPPITKSRLLGSNALGCVIIQGIQDTIRQGDSYLEKNMPSFQKLSTAELTNLVNYINHRWSTDFKETTIIQMEKTVSDCLQQK